MDDYEGLRVGVFRPGKGGVFRSKVDACCPTQLMKMTTTRSRRRRGRGGKGRQYEK